MADVRGQVAMDEREEGELSSDESTSVEFEDDLMQHTILPIHEPIGNIPKTGEEYLFMVKMERKSLPKVVSVSSYQPSPRTLSSLISFTTIDAVEIDTDWQMQVLETFMHDREKWNLEVPLLYGIPAISDWRTWKTLLAHGDQLYEPSVEILRSLTQASLIKLIDYHTIWIEEEGALSEFRYRWLYCLFANLSEAMGSDDVASLRSLVKCLIKCSNRNYQIDSIIVIVAKCYGQSDLIK